LVFLLGRLMGTIDILLIEDNPHDAEMIIASLKENRFKGKILTLRDGAEALDYLFGEQEYIEVSDVPKFILLDLKLPKIDGFEVLEKVRSDERTRYIPVVVLTSSNEDRDKFECYRLGANSYIVKPVDYESFSQSIFEIGNYWANLNKNPYRLSC